jgi:hypothetical protein
MNAHVFDELSRRLSAGLPRRGTVTLLTGALASLILRAAPPAAAACKKVGRNCDRNGDCCEGARCKNGTCKCRSGRTNCDGLCYRLNTDEAHCGACGNACASGETCCDGACFDLDRDEDHCGSCDVECVQGQVCSDGRCNNFGGN